MRNKGFTLMELVAVMVIIVLLSSAIAPGILGYIDDMQNRSYINDARMAVTSAQTELMDVYQSGKAIISAEKKSRWKTRMEYGADIYLSVGCAAVTGGNEKNAFTIEKALFKENGVQVYYEKGEYRVLASGETVADPGIIMTEVSASTLIAR